MSGEGTYKGFLGILLAVLAVVVICYWKETLTFLRIMGGFAAMDARLLWEQVPKPGFFSKP